MDSKRPLFATVVVASFSVLPGCATGAANPALTVSPAPISSTAATGVRRELLIQRDLPELPGWETRLSLIEFPPGTASPLHDHPVLAAGYVLEGAFESGFGEGQATVTRAGQGFVDLPNEPHRFRNVDPSRPLRFVVSGTFRKGDPLFRLLPVAGGP